MKSKKMMTSMTTTTMMMMTITKWRKDGFSVARREVYCTGSNLVGGSEKFSVFAHFGRVTCLAPDQRHPVIVTPSPKM